MSDSIFLLSCYYHSAFSYAADIPVNMSPNHNKFVPDIAGLSPKFGRVKLRRQASGCRRLSVSIGDENISCEHDQQTGIPIQSRTFL